MHFKTSLLFETFRMEICIYINMHLYVLSMKMYIDLNVKCYVSGESSRYDKQELRKSEKAAVCERW